MLFSEPQIIQTKPNWNGFLSFLSVLIDLQIKVSAFDYHPWRTITIVGKIVRTWGIRGFRLLTPHQENRTRTSSCKIWCFIFRFPKRWLFFFFWYGIEVNAFFFFFFLSLKTPFLCSWQLGKTIFFFLITYKHTKSFAVIICEIV